MKMHVFTKKNAEYFVNSKEFLPLQPQKRKTLSESKPS